MIPFQPLQASGIGQDFIKIRVFGSWSATMARSCLILFPSLPIVSGPHSLLLLARPPTPWCVRATVLMRRSMVHWQLQRQLAKFRAMWQLKFWRFLAI
jgi:hypothetical protein